VVPGLQEFDPGIGDPVHHAVLVIDAPGPTSSQVMPQGFRFSNSVEGIAARGLDQFEQSKRDLTVRLYPEGEIHEKLPMEEYLKLTGLLQRPTSRRNCSIVILRSRPRFASRIAPSNRLALFGDRSR
jgi:hypothetical protein